MVESGWVLSDPVISVFIYQNEDQTFLLNDFLVFKSC